MITEEDLGEGIPEIRDHTRKAADVDGASIKHAVEELERRMIGDMLQTTGNNQQRTAKALGLSRQGLINKMKRYRLHG